MGMLGAEGQTARGPGRLRSPKLAMTWSGPRGRRARGWEDSTASASLQGAADRALGGPGPPEGGQGPELPAKAGNGQAEQFPRTNDGFARYPEKEAHRLRCAPVAAPPALSVCSTG